MATLNLLLPRNDKPPRGGIVVTSANALVSDVTETHREAALNLVNLFFGLGGLATPFLSAKSLGSELVSAIPSPHVPCSR
jgi:fucose permease